MPAIQYTHRGRAERLGASGRSLTQAVLAAVDAPSILNTQPWRWRINHDVAELRAVRDRPLAVIDPDGRMLGVSCGAALHHAYVALAADGNLVEEHLLPNDHDPDLLATLRCVGTLDRAPHLQRLRRAIGLRRTDRRPFADCPVPEDALDRLRAAVEVTGASLHILRQQDLAELTERTDHHARYAVIVTDTDLPRDWLIAGKALSAVLLTAAVEGLATSVMTDLVEVGSVRETLRRILRNVGHPEVVVRVGIASRSTTPTGAGRLCEDPATVED